MFASRQTRLAPGDLTDVRIPAGGTPGFLTFNARGGVTINRTLQVTLGLENLTNRTYRTHGSGIDARRHQRRLRHRLDVLMARSRPQEERRLTASSPSWP